MRHGMMNRRPRNNRGGQPRRGGNGSSRMQVFDSNGPDVRIRGTAHQVHEKYIALARDAGSAGDRILAENYLQHAEHYQRMINSWALEDDYQPSGQDVGEEDSLQPQSVVPAEAQQNMRRENRDGFDPSRRRRHPYQQRQPYAPNPNADRGGNNGRDEDLGLPASILGARPATSSLSDASARNEEMAES